MIKGLPGWVNFLLLALAYSIVAQGLALLIQDRHLLALQLTTIFCGGYLAKWRFYDNGWRHW